MALVVAEDVLRLDVSVADALGVDVGDGPHQLVGIEFHDEVGHHCLALQVLFHHAVSSVGDIVHNNVEVNLLRLVAVGEEGLAHFDAVGMVQHLENCELTVLVALVLEHFLDGDGFAGLSDGGLEDDSEGAVADNLLGVIGHTLYRLGDSYLPFVVYRRLQLPKHV